LRGEIIHPKIPEDEPVGRFLNVDLEIWSRRNLGPLAEEFNGSTLHCGRTPRGWHASFEVEPARSADSTVKALVECVRSLPADARALWDAAGRRDFNIGIQGGTGSAPFELFLTPGTLADVARLGGRIVVTVYGTGADGQSASG
jgi:hypothetical protein